MRSIRKPAPAISLLLVLAVLAVFWRVGGYDFVDYDDGTYVFNNPYVVKGWSWEGLRWAFTTNLHGHWHPLTWVSLMTDAQLFGMHAGAFHLVNLLFHVLNTLLLFHVLNRMTGAVFCSAFVAAMFGLHPLHVEPVAWVADRKDVLGTFFWMTTLWFYIRYVSAPRTRTALPVLAAFLGALLTKSMAVTLPFVLLVLDYWPLRRWATIPLNEKPLSPLQAGDMNSRKSRRAGSSGIKSAPVNVPSALDVQVKRRSFAGLLLEKAPLLLLTILCAAVALVVYQEKQTASFDIWKTLPSLQTVARAVYAYTRYLYQTVWPAGLAVPYPQVYVFPLVQTFLSACLLACVSFIAYRRRKQSPYLMAGWLWYLITLLPVSGLVQGGTEIQADRYTYIPLIGVFIMVAWGISELVAKSPIRRWILVPVAVFCVLVCMAVSWAQVGHWENTVTLFSHVVEVSPNNEVALNNLGLKLLGLGRTEEALSCFREAIQITPNECNIHVNLGNAYKALKDLEKAKEHYERALLLDPSCPNASYNLANLHLQRNELELCEKYFLQAIKLDEQNYMARTNLGAAYSRMGRSSEAIACFHESLKIQPRQHLAYYALGLEHLKLNDLEKAESFLRRALEIKPDYERAYHDLGTVMMKLKRREEAIRFFQKALEINPGFEKARESLEEVKKAQ